MDKSISPFDKDHLPLSDAITFLSEVIYPKEHRTASRKRVRERVRYATKLGQVEIQKRKGVDHVVMKPFFVWARSKWPELELPPHVLSRKIKGDGALGLDGNSTYRIFSPIGPELGKRVAAERELQDLREEKTRLLKQIEELEPLADIGRRQLEKTREKKAAAGRKARGIRKRRTGDRKKPKKK